VHRYCDKVAGRPREAGPVDCRFPYQSSTNRKKDMNQKRIKSLWTFRRATVIGGVAAALLCRSALGQTIPNPNFAIDTFTNPPGYVSGNFPITGWTANPTDEVGLNPAGDQSPFADNGIVPVGTNVAFIQSGVDPSATNATLSTTISGLTVGTIYKVNFRVNAGLGGSTPLQVLIDTNQILAVNVAPAESEVLPYNYIGFEFTAAKTSQTLTLMNDDMTSNTLLVAAFTITPSDRAWIVSEWTDDSDIGVDSSYFYTHAYSFNNSANVTVNGVPFTGVTGANPQVPGKFYTTNLANTFGGDTGNAIDPTSTGYGIAQNFCYGAVYLAGNYEGITILGLTPGTKYVATVYSTAFEGSTNASTGLWTRALTWVSGDDWLTVNQDEFDTAGVRNGITYSYTYTADSTGSVTLKVFPIQNYNTSAHLYGFSNRLAEKENVAPVIISQPQGTVVSPDLPVSFSVAAEGIPAPAYQWRLNGAAISGAQAATYAVNATSATAGNYDVVVSNSAGSVTSAVAVLTLGASMVVNPSFEADTFTVYPGYCSGNTAITGWTLGLVGGGLDLGGGGINPAGSSPFADNGTIPNGVNVAFIQANGVLGYLGQVVSNFNVGSAYVVHYYENARSSGVPWLEVRVGGSSGAGGISVVAPHAVNPVGGDNPYHEIYSAVFTAASTALELDFLKSDPISGQDTTVLLDNITILPIPAGTAPYILSGGNPQPALVSVGGSASFSGQGIGSPSLSYQWLMNGVPITGANQPAFSLNDIQKTADGDYSLVIKNSFGSATSAVARLTVYEPIADLFSTGLDANGSPLAGGAPDPHYSLTVNPDTGPGQAIVETGIPSAWMADSTTAQWIGPQANTSTNLGGDYVYRTVIDLTGRDPSTLMIQGEWASDNEGFDIRVNGVSTGNTGTPYYYGFTSYTPFWIYGTNSSLNWVAGTNTLDFYVQNDGAGYTGLNVDILESNLPIPPGVAPTITRAPLSQSALLGATVTLTAAGSGSAPLSYQWEKNGVAIVGQTNLTLTLTNISPLDNGSYSFVVSNSAGSASATAVVSTAYEPVPGICFGTGLAADGSFLAVNATDPHYALTVSPDPNFPGPGAIVVSNAWPIATGVWVLDGPNSQWIAPQADQSGASYPDGSYGGNYPGAYVYETTFNLGERDPSTVLILGGWAADDGGTNIVLNGASTGLATASGFGALTPFTLSGTNGLVAGTNTLDFEMYNGGSSWNPTGLRVDLLAYVVIPPTLTISHTGAKVTISWIPSSSAHPLQSAPAVTGPWTVITGATSPFTTNATSARIFYSIAK
jgi:hypothetical protein